MSPYKGRLQVFIEIVSTVNPTNKCRGKIIDENGRCIEWWLRGGGGGWGMERCGVGGDESEVAMWVLLWTRSVDSSI